MQTWKGFAWQVLPCSTRTTAPADLVLAWLLEHGCWGTIGIIGVAHEHALLLQSVQIS